MNSLEMTTQPTPEIQKEIEALTQAPAAPFNPLEVKFKPAVISGSRAMALAYVDARAIQDRLDHVVGVLGWQDEYECLPDGSVVCQLRLRLGDEWIMKMDVGGPSEQPDEGDRRKAAFSDALKRAAVKFGIGRYLYRLPAQWVDYDAKKRQFINTPQLPADALPRQEAPARRTTPEGNRRTPPVAPKGPRTVPMATADATEPPRHPASLPADGVELHKRLSVYDAHLTRQGLCTTGALLQHIVTEGKKAGYDADLTTWAGPAIQLAVDETKRFETAQRQRLKKEVA